MNFDDTLQARAELTTKEVEKMKSNYHKDWWVWPSGAFVLTVWMWGFVSFIKFILNLFI